MAVLLVEGFTGSPVIAPNNWSTNTLRTLGWTLNAVYNGSTSTIPDDGNIVINVEADPVFPTRSQAVLRKGVNNSTITMAEQMIRPLPDMAGHQKFVYGFTAMYTSTNTTDSNHFLCIGGTTPFSSSTGSYPNADTLAQICFNANDTATIYIVQSSPGQTIQMPNLKRGKFFHVEFLIERDVNRTRMYVDGTLVADWTGALASNGISFTHLIISGQTGIPDMKVSNVYVLGLDTVHTGILGPGARVLEIAPQTDLAVTWDRPVGYASNAAVLQQFNNAAPPAYLTTGDPNTDLYKGPDAVAANAATVYGAAFKAYGMTMAEGTHVLTAATQYDGVNGQSTKSGTLVLSTMNNYVFDVSLNPKTGLKWTPSEITAAGIGLKLLS